jgi:hypothetical protein
MHRWTGIRRSAFGSTVVPPDGAFLLAAGAFLAKAVAKPPVALYGKRIGSAR